jgi:WD40 repeat protein
VLFAPNGALVAADGKGGLALYPLTAGDAKPLAVKGKLLDFAPDGKSLLTADGNSVHVWDWPGGTRRRTAKLPADARSAAISPDGRTALIGVSGRTAAVFNLEAGTVSELPVKVHWFAHAAGFAPGGQVVCGTVGGARAEAWGLTTRGRLRQYEQPPATAGHFYLLSFAVSPDGRKAASSHSDGSLAVYETATGQLLAHFRGHRDSVISIAWAGSDQVLSAGADHQVLVWDASVNALAGKVGPLSAADRAAAWN